MSTLGNALQKGLVQRLSAVVSPIKVYDAVPQKTSFPYVTIDALDVSAEDYLSSHKTRWFIYLSVWSTHRGSLEVMNVMKKIHDALHRQRFPLEMGRVIDCQVKRQSTEKDIDDATFTGVMTLQIRTEN